MSEVFNYKEELIFITNDGNNINIKNAYFIFDPPDEEYYIISYKKNRGNYESIWFQDRYKELRKDLYNKTYFKRANLNMVMEKCNKEISSIGEKYKNEIIGLEEDILFRKGKIILIEKEINNIINKELNPNRNKSIREKNKSLRRLYKRVENKSKKIEELKIKLSSLRKDTFFALKNVLKL
ncbi:UNVERIFIED_CONTAM: hypothetical protein C4Z64_01500 [Clostridioides difficile]